MGGLEPSAARSASAYRSIPTCVGTTSAGPRHPLDVASCSSVSCPRPASHHSRDEHVQPASRRRLRRLVGHRSGRRGVCARGVHGRPGQPRGEPGLPPQVLQSVHRLRGHVRRGRVIESRWLVIHVADTRVVARCVEARRRRCVFHDDHVERRSAHDRKPILGP